MCSSISQIFHNVCLLLYKQKKSYQVKSKILLKDKKEKNPFILLVSQLLLFTNPVHKAHSYSRSRVVPIFPSILQSHLKWDQLREYHSVCTLFQKMLTLKEIMSKRYGVSFGGDEHENVLELIMAIVVKLCKYTKKCWVVHFKWDDLCRMWVISQ